MRDYFNGRVDQNLAGLYGVAGPEELTGLDVRAFEVADGDQLAMDSLTKVWFTAHARGLASRAKGVGFLSGSDMSQAIISARHRQLHIPDMPRLFKNVPGARELNPHLQMLSRLRTAGGEKITRLVGLRDAARIFVGQVVLTEPDYSVMHPDPKARKLVRNTFLRDKA
jgi:hypothetical protein